MTTVFVRSQLKRIKLELQELIGTISLEELVTNRRFTNRYQELHLELIRAI
ncbi:MAG: hypothetical protein KBD76_13505 [Bacteriovorax sp.]|nr:hypothetical protein [Bacteriovorax sp.]